jgi:hypothetical protein
MLSGCGGEDESRPGSDIMSSWETRGIKVCALKFGGSSSNQPTKLNKSGDAKQRKEGRYNDLLLLTHT